MKLAISIACAALFGLSTVAYAGCSEQHVCADGFTWSSEKGVCIPKSVTS